MISVGQYCNNTLSEGDYNLQNNNYTEVSNPRNALLLRDQVNMRQRNTQTGSSQGPRACMATSD